MTAPKKTILVYGLAGWEPEKEARVVLNAIRNLGWRSIFFCDRECATGGLADRVVVNSNWSYELLRQVAVEEKVDYALLIVDFATPLVGRLNEELGLPGPSVEQYHKVNDKLRWSHLAREAGLKMPDEKLILSEQDFDDPTWADGPFIVKPTKSTGTVSNKPWGYKFYESLGELKAFLHERGAMNEFLEINRRGGELGKYLVQRRIDHVFFGNLGLTYIGDRLIFNELHDCLFHPYPNQTLQYASHGPFPVPEKYRAQVEGVLGILKREVDFKNTGINIDLLEDTDGNVFTVDINVRYGSTWSTFLPLRGIAFMEEAMKAFVGLPYRLPEMKGAYLRHKVSLPPGVLKQVHWPSRLDPRVRLEGVEHCQPGVRVPAVTGRTNWPVETLIAAENLEECHRLHQETVASIEVEYEREVAPVISS